MNHQNNLDYARAMDAGDPLKHLRTQYHIPQHNGKACTYFTGNSLGLQPKTVTASVQQELSDWARLGVEGHFQGANPWFSYHEIFPPLLKDIVGAKEHEIVVMNQLSVNLHLLMTSFYRPTSQRYRIICEAKAFPSDQYAIESQVRLHGFDPADAIVEVKPAEGFQYLDEATILKTIEQYGDSVALVLFGGVHYYSGQVLNMQKISTAAHAIGAYAGFDLAHAVGNIKLNLHDWEVDFACWCSYKYLNSGPGGVAGAYIHEKHGADTSLPRLAGWWGHKKETRFRMESGFDPIPTAEGWQLSNAPVLSMAAHKAALEVFATVGMDALIEKSRKLTGYLFWLMDEINESTGNTINIITPRDEESYGCQVSLLMMEKGREVFEALTIRGVIADWREPNVIRVAPVPMYNSFEDVWNFGSIIKEILSKA